MFGVDGKYFYRIENLKTGSPVPSYVHSSNCKKV